MRIKSWFERSPVIQLTKKEDTMKRLCGTYWSWNKWINHLGSRRRTGVLLGPCFSHKYPSQLQASETPEALPRATGWSKIYMLAVEYNSEPHKERERKRKRKLWRLWNPSFDWLKDLMLESYLSAYPGAASCPHPIQDSKLFLFGISINLY
jgi:hypothetical protein